jgi:uncharacterized protein (TIGR03086 family)
VTAQAEPLAGAVELLDRALGYTRVVLAGVTCEALHRPTPCTDWDLGQLLAHMEDALDAFTEAAGGRVDRGTPAPPADQPAGLPRVARLREKACALLGAWSGPTPADVDVAGDGVDSQLLLAAAALEITVHGWDVGEALGGAPPVPERLAVRLLEVAGVLVQPEDRAVRFRPPRPVAPDAGGSERLLAFLGRG